VGERLTVHLKELRDRLAQPDIDSELRKTLEDQAEIAGATACDSKEARQAAAGAGRRARSHPRAARLIREQALLTIRSCGDQALGRRALRPS
jgi:hypothetical protein